MREAAACDHSEQMTSLMSLAIDDLLDAEDKLDLQQHLAGCSACQAEYDAMRQVSALFEEAPMVGPPLGFAIRVERRLEEKERKRRRIFGSVAIVTSSLSLAGVTVATVSLIILGLMAFQGVGSLPSMQQSSSILSLVASGMGIVGKGATLFLADLLMRYGPPLVLLLGVGLAVLVGMWVWLFVKRPGKSQRNGYI